MEKKLFIKHNCRQYTWKGKNNGRERGTCVLIHAFLKPNRIIMLNCRFCSLKKKKKNYYKSLFLTFLRAHACMGPLINRITFL
jgi:type I site-specific restriction-modification system R (restriction) subunit